MTTEAVEQKTSRLLLTSSQGVLIYKASRKCPLSGRRLYPRRSRLTSSESHLFGRPSWQQRRAKTQVYQRSETIWLGYWTRGWAWGGGEGVSKRLSDLKCPRWHGYLFVHVGGTLLVSHYSSGAPLNPSPTLCGGSLLADLAVGRPNKSMRGKVQIGVTSGTSIGAPGWGQGVCVPVRGTWVHTQYFPMLSCSLWLPICWFHPLFNKLLLVRFREVEIQ